MQDTHPSTALLGDEVAGLVPEHHAAAGVHLHAQPASDRHGWASGAQLTLAGLSLGSPASFSLPSPSSCSQDPVWSPAVPGKADPHSGPQGGQAAQPTHCAGLT